MGLGQREIHQVNDLKQGYIPHTDESLHYKLSTLFPHIFKSDDKKPPKGFEKFFKKKEDRET
jgi:hypothetical protein